MQGYQPYPTSLPDLPANIALLAEDGHLVSLDKSLEEASQAPSRGSPLLQERGNYVLVQIISKWGPRHPSVIMLEYKDSSLQTTQDPAQSPQP